MGFRILILAVSGPGRPAGSRLDFDFVSNFGSVFRSGVWCLQALAECRFREKVDGVREPPQPKP